MGIRPLAIDLFAGLGGWAEGFLSEGFEVIGFDIEYRPYSGHLVLQDVLTLHGSQFRDASVIVASPPCQRYSYMAMPWTRARQLAEWYRESPVRIAELNALFDACFRIQLEASEAARRYIPLVIENVKGAQSWVGRAKWHYGSYYLWGDVPALMPSSRQFKVGRNFHQFAKTGVPSASSHGAPHEASVQRAEAIKDTGVKNEGNGTWFGVSHGREYQGQPENGIKRHGSGPEWFDNGIAKLSSGGDARKRASAMIAKIPFPLAQWIARVFKPC